MDSIVKLRLNGDVRYNLEVKIIGLSGQKVGLLKIEMLACVCYIKFFGQG